MERRERVKFVNSLPGFKSLVLVGTRDQEGRTNLAIASTVIHLGSDPPLLGMASRPAAVPRHTLENILATGVYTFNHVAESFYPAAHQTSARYPREVSEFRAAGLTEAWEEGVDAPFVGEASVRIAQRLAERLELRSNGVTLLVGEVTDVFHPAGAREKDGYLDLALAGTVAGAGLDGYYRATRLSRLSYAKPGRPLSAHEPGEGEPLDLPQP